MIWSSIKCQGILSLSFKFICPQLRQCFGTWQYLLEKVERFFFEKNSIFSRFWFFLFQIKVFLISAIKLSIRVEKDNSMKRYNLIRILQQICYLHRFWKNSSFISKNTPFLQKKPKLPTYLENSLWVAFYGIFAITPWLKIFKFGAVEHRTLWHRKLSISK